MILWSDVVGRIDRSQYILFAQRLLDCLYGLIVIDEIFEGKLRFSRDSVQLKSLNSLTMEDALFHAITQHGAFTGLPRNCRLPGEATPVFYADPKRNHIIL